MAKHRNIRKNPHRSNATDRRKSLTRAAKSAEKATHEVAKTDASDPHPSFFHGQYEPCSIVSDDGSTHTVRIQDGKGGVTIDGSGSASELILKLIKTFDLSTRQDNGDLMGRESLNAVINRTLR